MWHMHYLYIWVIVHIVFWLSEENYYPCYLSHIINPSPFFNFLRVGLSSTESLNVQVTWRRERCRIRWSVDHRASIAWTRGPPIAIKNTCFNKGIIMVLIKSRATHLDCQIAIQGAETHAFYNASHQASSGPSINFDDSWFHKNQFEVIFHNIPFFPISTIDLPSDLINFKENIKNFLISLWIRPLFTIIPFNLNNFHQIGKFRNIFDTRPCEIDDL